jgi:hypothetical protein
MRIPIITGMRERRAARAKIEEASQRILFELEKMPPMSAVVQGIIAEVREQPESIIRNIVGRQTHIYRDCFREFSSILESFRLAGLLDAEIEAALKANFSRHIEVDFFGKLKPTKDVKDEIKPVADAFEAHVNVFVTRLEAFAEELKQTTAEGTPPNPEQVKAMLERIVTPITPSPAGVGSAERADGLGEGQARA